MTKKLAEYVVTCLRKRFEMGKLCRDECDIEVGRMHQLLRMARKRKVAKVPAVGAMSSEDNLQTLPLDMGNDEGVPVVAQDSLSVKFHSDPNNGSF